MSKVSVKINNMKNKLDGISGLDDIFVMNKLNILDKYIDILLLIIDDYLLEDDLNGTIFRDKVKRA